MQENEELKRVLEKIKMKERCAFCPLKNSKPLIFVPDRDVKIAVITEGPNREEDPELIASILDHPIYTYLLVLFGCKFSPTENATAYWTHLRKCFIKSRDNKPIVDEKKGNAAVRICKNYLVDELKAVKPELVIAVGGQVKDYLYKISKDRRIAGNLREVFMNNIFENFRLGELKFDLAVLPHPSGKNRIWNEFMSYKAREIFENVRDRILEILK